MSLLSKELSRVFSSTTVEKLSILWLPAFFMVQLSHLCMTYWKNHSLDYTDPCRQSDIFAFFFFNIFLYIVKTFIFGISQLDSV